jgi:hypothetical protein
MAEFISIKPKKIQAVQLTRMGGSGLIDWLLQFGADVTDTNGSAIRFVDTEDEKGIFLYVKANDSWVPIEISEWIVRDSLGLYPIKDEIFRETYRPVEDSDE